MQAQSSSSIREEKGFGNRREDNRRPSDVPSQDSGNQQRLSSKDVSNQLYKILYGRLYNYFRDRGD